MIYQRLSLVATTILAFNCPTAVFSQEYSNYRVSFIEENIEEVCDIWTDTRQAFDTCIEENTESGVEIYTYSDGGELRYPLDWDFCIYNQELDSNIASNLCEI
jgi:hypothetical protein